MGLFILLLFFFFPQKVMKQLEYSQNGENQFIVGAYMCLLKEHFYMFYPVFKNTQSKGHLHL